MKRSRRELSVNVVIDCFTFKDNQITLFTCFTFMYPNQVWDYLKQAFFYWVGCVLFDAIRYRFIWI